MNENKRLGALQSAKVSTLGLVGGTLIALPGMAAAQSATGNGGADTVIDAVDGLQPIAVAVVAAAVALVIIPWGAKLAIRAFKGVN